MKTLLSPKADPAALVEALNARLLAGHSATLVLEQWCADQGIAASPHITARCLHAIDKPATAEQRARLGVGPRDVVRYRRVRLYCGDILLSEADNWYVSSRLTPPMNQLLDKSDIPFGRVVQSLRPTRDNLAVNFLHPADVAARLLEHRALLLAASGQPLAEVAETYFSTALPPV